MHIMWKLTHTIETNWQAALNDVHTYTSVIRTCNSSIQKRVDARQSVSEMFCIRNFRLAYWLKSIWHAINVLFFFSKNEKSNWFLFAIVIIIINSIESVMSQFSMVNLTKTSPTPPLPPRSQTLISLQSEFRKLFISIQFLFPKI